MVHRHYLLSAPLVNLQDTKKNRARHSSFVTLKDAKKSERCETFHTGKEAIGNPMTKHIMQPWLKLIRLVEGSVGELAPWDTL